MVFRHPVYIIIYIVMMGLMGLVASGATSSEAPEAENFNVADRPFAVIDRDGSAVSLGLVSHLSQHGQLIVIADEQRAIEDAIALNQVCCIFQVTSGYGDDFLAAARSGSPAPEIASIASIEATASTYLASEAQSYLNALRIGAASGGAMSDQALVDRALEVAAMRAPMDIVQAADAINPNNLYPFYIKFSAYPMTCGIGILVALMLADFRRGGLNRRNLAAPLSTTSMNLHLAAASMIVVLMAFCFVNLLALAPIVGGLEFWSRDPGAAALIALASLAYSLLPLAIGFFVSQFNSSETAVNGVINIISLAMVFLSGIMMGGSSYLEGAMLTLGRFMPTYWLSEAIDAVAGPGGFGTGPASARTLSYYLSCLGIMLLFDLAAFSVALLCSRLRAQAAEAGGYTTAATAD
jgi:ABC-2 type transport system permease protein